MGKEWCAEVIAEAYEKLAEDLPLPPNVPGVFAAAILPLNAEGGDVIDRFPML